MKKAELAMNTIVILVITLVVIAVSSYLVYKYILGPGKDMGNQTKCVARGGSCYEPENKPTGAECFYRMFGCPEGDTDAQKDKTYCCISELK